MKENVSAQSEQPPRPPRGCFKAIMSLDANTSLRVVKAEGEREVFAATDACQWNNNPPVSNSRKQAYILVCLPILFIVYLVIRHNLP